MNDREKNSAAALEIMRQWEWKRCDPDGGPFDPAKLLSQVVNRLAMDGLISPPSAVLTLLCRGDLISRADYRWQKYQWGKFYRLEEGAVILKPKQWQTLADLIEDERQEQRNGGFLLENVELTKLGMLECYPYDWEFAESRFCTALCPPDTPVHDRTYFEEWFSAYEIEVWPRFLESASPDLEPEEAVGPTAKAGGRPLAEWWPDFVAELVAYVAEIGLPDGIGHQGQSEVIREVCSRLSERGKLEPSRSQIQEVVNAVLRRMRSAGK